MKKVDSSNGVCVNDGETKMYCQVDTRADLTASETYMCLERLVEGGTNIHLDKKRRGKVLCL